ncbi:MAG TPA: hypothetical protein VMN36_02525 [Verrucomicrobiales bacterium]|nr:hypothetical protein [Verrucomicrobiales bacterium]
MSPTLSHNSRRHFLNTSTRGLLAAAALGGGARIHSQEPGARPESGAGATVLNPRNRVPVGLIIDDSTCLVNLNRFAMPQFDAAWNGRREVYHRNWKEWPLEIPDAFVRKFGEWCAEHGVRGKYSVVPFPACVGRLDRELPGWSRRELEESIALVRGIIMPNWDIHPEMVTHTRVIDLKTGHPYPDITPEFMENWDWTTGRSVDEIAAYQAYSLQILGNVGLPCEGVTTPGGYGNRALPELAQATLESVRDVFGAEIPHYFRHLYDEGEESVAPRVECASGLDGSDPRCVVSIIGCTGDWTGGWDNVEPAGPDRFITPDLQRGRMVDVITRGEPAMMVCHWTGIHWNGEERGFQVFQEVVRRLHERFDNLIWMKLSELARYWSAKELTQLERTADTLRIRAPFACPAFTLRLERSATQPPAVSRAGTTVPLREVSSSKDLSPGTFHQKDSELTACFELETAEQTLLLG